jgi:hypothetical protein
MSLYLCADVYQLARPELNLPRFEQVILDPPSENDRIEPSTVLEKASKNGRIDFDLWVGPRGSPPTIVRTERLELVNTPGAYNLYLPEFTKGLRLHIGACIEGIEVEVLVRPQGEGQVLRNIGNMWSCDHLLTPGQGIEIKFRRQMQKELALESERR